MKRTILLISFLLLVSSLNSQNTPMREESFDYYLELISELSVTEEEDPDFNDLADQLYDLWQSPIDINAAEPYDLARLFWLDEIHLNRLIDYVRRYKPLASIFELAYIPGFDSTTVATLKPFIIISDTKEVRQFKKMHNWLLYRTGRTLETQAGFKDGKFDGDAWK